MKDCLKNILISVVVVVVVMVVVCGTGVACPGLRACESNGQAFWLASGGSCYRLFVIGRLGRE